MKNFYLSVACWAVALFCPDLFCEEKITFAPPPGWQLADSTLLSSNVKALVIGPKIGMMPPSINLATEAYKGTLQEYLKIVKSIASAKGAEWKDLGKFKTAAGNAHLSQLDTKSQWGDLRMMHIMLLKDGVMYILTATALKEEFPSNYKQFFTALSSLKFVDEPN
jgi:hypothetical protein